MSRDHEHDHEHGHHPEPPSDLEARTLALQSLLEEKGLFTGADVDRIVSAFEHDIGPMIGARVVAWAWTDGEFKRRLLADAAGARHGSCVARKSGDTARDGAKRRN